MKSTITASALALALALAVTLAGCTAAAPSPEPVSSAETGESTYGGFPIDPPAADEVVLTITASESVDFTYAELQALATVEITIFEPFIEQQQSFTGVPLADLLSTAGVPATARIETVALNDYAYADSASQWIDNDALLAVYRDGALIPMDQGGPIRIVFAEGSDAFELLDAWNWSLRSITVIE